MDKTPRRKMRILPFPFRYFIHGFTSWVCCADLVDKFPPSNSLSQIKTRTGKFSGRLELPFSITNMTVNTEQQPEITNVRLVVT